MDTLVSVERRKIGSVQRAIDILNLFSRTIPELGTTEIAEALGLHKSTVAGLIFTLEANGYLDQNPATRKYRLGLRILERSSALLSQVEVRKVAMPWLEQLRSWFGEGVKLAIRDGVDVVYIEQLQGTHPLGVRDEVGKRAPVYCTALGKALVAWLPPSEVSEIVGRCKFTPFTPNTITSPGQFIAELDRTRARGYALDDEEIEMGGRCISAPIFNHTGRPVAAVSVSVPLPRIPISEIPRFAEKVRETAKTVSTRLGYMERPY
jgi:IclR family transcriptional regulator, KDG regulon repressor